MLPIVLLFLPAMVFLVFVVFVLMFLNVAFGENPRPSGPDDIEVKRNNSSQTVNTTFEGTSSLSSH